MASTLRAALYSATKAVSERVLPPLQTSRFDEKGVLTPAEFLAAGDFLVGACPSWKWEGGDAAKAWPFLPSDKQFLVSRNLPCATRAAAVEGYAGGAAAAAAAAEEVDAGGGAGGGWLEARAGEGEGAGGAEGEEDEEGFEALPLPPALAAAAARDISAAAPPPPDLSSDLPSSPAAAADVPDISALALGGPAAAAAPLVVADEDDDAAAPPPAAAADQERDQGMRYYDAVISYDKYHQVPRIFFLGYSGRDRTPLSAEEMLADVASGYAAGARKTVTVEAHPHVRHGGRLISVHPCQHAPVLRRLAAMSAAAASDEDEAAEGEGAEGQASGGAARPAPPRFPVERALVLFLKFVAGVVPTVEYDFTMAA